MNGEVLPVVKKMKLLGTIICDDLKWDENTSFLIKRANTRLLLLRKAAQYTNLIEDLKSINSIFSKIPRTRSTIHFLIVFFCGFYGKL